MVSVLMPTYNRASIIRESIDSVLKQSYTDLELVIVDDGSTDNTKEVINSYSDPRIQFHVIAHSGLVSHVRNVTLERAKGEYLAFIDSDDLWESDHLESLMAAIKKYDDVGIVFSNVTEFEAQQVLRAGIYSEATIEMLKGPVDILPIILHSQVPIYPTSILIRHEGAKAAGKFSEALSITETNFIGRIARSYKAIYTGKITAKVRKHAANHSDTARGTAFVELFMLIDELKEFGYLSDQEHRQLSFMYHYRFGIERIECQDPGVARSAFFKALAIKPWSLKSVSKWMSTWVS